MKLSIAFLCYKDSSAPYLPDFLSSLNTAIKELMPEFKISIVAGDNSGLSDHSNLDIIRNSDLNLEHHVEYINFQDNLGFAAAYNLLFRQAIDNKADYFLMLNPDMYLEVTSISRMLSALIADDSLTAVCPKIYQWNFSDKKLTNIIDSCGLCLKPGLRFFDLGQGVVDKGQFDDVKIIAPSGAAAMFRLSKLDVLDVGLGLYDERFFMYKEDCDLAYRLNMHHLSTKLVPDSICYHDRSAAKTGGLWSRWRSWRRRSRQTRSWSFVNQHLLFFKYNHLENLYSRFLICLQICFYFVFSLLLAQFLLKNYAYLWRQFRGID